MLTFIGGKVCLDPRSKEMTYLSSGLRNICARIRDGSMQYGICSGIIEVSGDRIEVDNLLRMLFRRWPNFSGHGACPVLDSIPFVYRETPTLWGRRREAADRYFDAQRAGTLWDVSSPYGRLRYELLHFLIVEVLSAAYAWKLYTWQTALRDCGMPIGGTKAIMFGALHGNGAFPATIERQLEALRLGELQKCRREVERILGWTPGLHSQTKGSEK